MQATVGSSFGAQGACVTSSVNINFEDLATSDGQTDAAHRVLSDGVTSCRAVDIVAGNSEKMNDDPSSLSEPGKMSNELLGNQMRTPPGLDDPSLQSQPPSNADQNYSEMSSSLETSARGVSSMILSVARHHESQPSGQSVDSSCPAAETQLVSKQGAHAPSGHISTKEGSLKIALPKQAQQKRTTNKMGSLVPKAARQSPLQQVGARPSSAKQSPPRKSPGKGSLAKPPPAMPGHQGGAFCKGGQRKQGPQGLKQGPTQSLNQEAAWTVHHQQNALWQLQREHVFHNQAMPAVPRASSRHKYQDLGGQGGFDNYGVPDSTGFHMQQCGNWPGGPLLSHVPWDPMSPPCGWGSPMNSRVPFGLGMRSRTAAADALKKFAIAADVRAMTQAHHAAREQKAILGRGLHPEDSDNLLWPPNPSKIFDDDQYEVIRRAAAEKVAAEIKAEVAATMQLEGRLLEPETRQSSSPSRLTSSKKDPQLEGGGTHDDIDHKQYTGRIKTYNAVQGFGFIDCPELWRKYECDVFLNHAVEGGLSIGGDVCFDVDFGRDGKPQARKVMMLDAKNEGPSTAQPILDQSVLAMAGQLRRGRVKSFNAAHGFGFLACPELQRALSGRDVYVSRVHAPNGRLSAGQEVDFWLTFDKNGQPQARDALIRTARRPRDNVAAVGSVVPASNLHDPLTFGMRLFT